MKIWELASGLHIQLSDEETELVDCLLEDENRALNEREFVLAQVLVNKSVFVKEEIEGKDKFSVNYSGDVWRD